MVAFDNIWGALVNHRQVCRLPLPGACYHILFIHYAVDAVQPESNAG